MWLGNRLTRHIRGSDAYWREQLSPRQYSVLRDHQPELPHTGNLLKINEAGYYKCAGCGSAVFGSPAKRTSSTGWLEFTKPFSEDNPHLQDSKLHGNQVTELICSSCKGFLGLWVKDQEQEIFRVSSSALVFHPQGNNRAEIEGDVELEHTLPDITPVSDQAKQIATLAQLDTQAPHYHDPHKVSKRLFTLMIFTLLLALLRVLFPLFSGGDSNQLKGFSENVRTVVDTVWPF